MQHQACRSPATAYGAYADIQHGRDLLLRQLVIPQQIEDFTLLIWQLLNSRMKLLPLGDTTWVVGDL